MKPATRKSAAPRAKTARAAAPKRQPATSGARTAARARAAGARTDPEVESFLRELVHPMKAEVAALRRIVLGVSPTIREGIKWNSPSFRTSEFFATLHLRARDGQPHVWLILHTGAKGRPGAKSAPRIDDPSGILEWLAKDRCLLSFADRRELRARRAALEHIVRQWIRAI